ncbi:MAG TPA: tRNA (adenosine(37)-N6)-dimethylallyltransferase MiaA [Ruminococcaceae bacterium]|nr:tRNA (adenosine(37)-N6)-dimethylallyltransferase MiaA [Oscillospiraceae bacterium]
MTQIPVLTVVGPTASGKTRLAVALAQRYHGEVVSADSMQLYRGMPIGTAQPTSEEMQGVPHHLIGILDPSASCSVADYVAMAGPCIAEIHARGHVPVIAGGTGLYVDSLLSGRKFEPGGRNDALRAELRREASEKGEKVLWERLAAMDPEIAAKLHPHNLGRIIRAIEVCETAGMTMSEMQRRSELAPSPYHAFKIGIRFAERETLYKRINARVDAMMEAGLLDEAKALLSHSNFEEMTASQAIGYKELAGYMRKEQTLEEAIDTIKRSTRRYAKRQLTWLNRAKDIFWIDADEKEFGLIYEQAIAAIDNSKTLCYNESMY